MACTGHDGDGDNDGNYVGPVTPTTWTNDPLTTSVIMIDTHHNELRTAIDNEITRWSQSWPADPGAVTSANKILSTHVRKLRDGIDAAVAWSWPAHLNDNETDTDDILEAQQYNAMRTQVNTIEAMCACDCAYACTCDCAYACTCDCDYACTCDCNYACTCNCDYSCGADKSDIRLKYDIEYI